MSLSIEDTSPRDLCIRLTYYVMTLVRCVPGYLLYASTEMFTKLCLGGSFLCLFCFARTEIEHRMPCCISISFIQVYFVNFYFLDLWEKLGKMYPAFSIQFFLNVQGYKSHIFRISSKFMKIHKTLQD